MAPVKSKRRFPIYFQVWKSYKPPGRHYSRLLHKSRFRERSTNRPSEESLYFFCRTISRSGSRLFGRYERRSYTNSLLRSTQPDTMRYDPSEQHQGACGPVFRRNVDYYVLTRSAFEDGSDSSSPTSSSPESRSRSPSGSSDGSAPSMKGRTDVPGHRGKTMGSVSAAALDENRI